MIFVAITAVLLVCLMAMVAALASNEDDCNPFPLDEGDAPCRQCLGTGIPCGQCRRELGGEG